jgi:hypothetical protein
MKRILQEKLQAVLPGKVEGNDPWASFESTRRTQRYDETNCLPPGMDITNQYGYLVSNMPLSSAGQTDVTNCAEFKEQNDGFHYHPMDSVDDQYSGEHAVDFYGEAKGEDDADNKVTGFAERANFLDRL